MADQENRKPASKGARTFSDAEAVLDYVKWRLYGKEHRHNDDPEKEEVDDIAVDMAIIAEP